MKKIYLLTTLLVICFAFRACSDDDDGMIYYAHPSEGLPSSINLTDAKYLVKTRDEGSTEFGSGEELKPYLFKYTTAGKIEPVRALYDNGINAQFEIDNIIAISDQHYIASITVDKSYLVMIDRTTGQIYKQEESVNNYYIVKNNVACMQKAYTQNKYISISGHTYLVDESQHKLKIISNNFSVANGSLITDLKGGMTIIDSDPHTYHSLEGFKETIGLKFDNADKVIDLNTDIIDLLMKFEDKEVNQYFRAYTAEFFADKEGNAYFATHLRDKNGKRYFAIYKAELKADKTGLSYILIDKVDVSKYFSLHVDNFVYNLGYNKYTNSIDFYPLRVSKDKVSTPTCYTANFNFDTQKIDQKELDDKIAQTDNNLNDCIVNDDFIIMKHNWVDNFEVVDRKDNSIQTLEYENANMSFYNDVSLNKTNFYLNPTGYINVRFPYVSEIDITRENLWKETKIDFDNDQAKKALRNQEVYWVYNLQ